MVIPLNLAFSPAFQVDYGLEFTFSIREASISLKSSLFKTVFKVFSHNPALMQDYSVG
jgi:hypothetical protein